jgi:hypothetical protein
MGSIGANVQAVSGSTTPHALAPASTRPSLGGRLGGGNAGDAGLGGYARAAAVSGGRQLLGLGEAGFKFVSAQVGQWRSGAWEGASARCCLCLG